MPFGLSKAPVTFNRLIVEVKDNVPNCVAYLDVVIFPNSWSDFLVQLNAPFSALDNVGFVNNLENSQFVYVQLLYPGYASGLGTLVPTTAKCNAIALMPIP